MDFISNILAGAHFEGQLQLNKLFEKKMSKTLNVTVTHAICVGTLLSYSILNEFKIIHGYLKPVTSLSICST
jgi:hypothetical protein